MTPGTHRRNNRAADVKMPMPLQITPKSKEVMKVTHPAGFMQLEMKQQVVSYLMSVPFILCSRLLRNEFPEHFDKWFR